MFYFFNFVVRGGFGCLKSIAIHISLKVILFWCFRLLFVLLCVMEDVASLKAFIVDLQKIIVNLQKELFLVKEELSHYKHPKNSKNSSIPPSKDENRPVPNQSLREKSGKKVGGQPGHKGYTLEMSADPTEIVALSVHFCTKCGNDISRLPSKKMERRQVIDIPPIEPIITEYQSFTTVCDCGHCNKADFPVGVETPIQYGAGVQSLTAYMSTRQYMSMSRLREYFTDLFHIPYSEGTVQNMLKKMATKATPFYERIKEAIQEAHVLGGDETSCKIDGKKGWFWTLQNQKYTFIHCSDNRGFVTLNQLFPSGFQNTIITHDAYSAWFKLQAKAHQLCLAHLQRDLNYFADCYKSCDWVDNIKQLFYQAIQQKQNSKSNAQIFKNKLEKLLENPPESKFSLLKRFRKRLQKHKDSIFTFLDYDFVPPDNNGSERAIRNIKVKSKISGQFKSIENANIFALLRSVIDTCIKNNQPILPTLNIIANFKAE